MATRPASKTKAPAAPPRALVYLASWLVPGLGHLWLGRRQRGLVFLVVLPAMFAIGLALNGRLFPFVWTEPLVALAFVADVAAGLPYLAARLLGAGAGQAQAVTYEYGNAFLITSGLLNMLVLIDAHDVAVGRR
jgi:hypothetical protein